MGEQENQDPRVVELVGGPLDGRVHEVHIGFPVPPMMGLPRNEGDARRHWYKRVSSDKFQFSHSDPDPSQDER